LLFTLHFLDVRAEQIDFATATLSGVSSKAHPALTRSWAMSCGLAPIAAGAGAGAEVAVRVRQRARWSVHHRRLHPHMLRHACGFALANKGHDTRALQTYLGHKNIQHTVRYTELSPPRFKDF
jgi:integrase